MNARHARARCVLKRYLRRAGVRVQSGIDDATLIDYSKLIYQLRNQS